MHQGKPLAVAVAALLEEPQALVVAGGSLVEMPLLIVGEAKVAQDPALHCDQLLYALRFTAEREALLVVADRVVKAALVTVGAAKVHQRLRLAAAMIQLARYLQVLRVIADRLVEPTPTAVGAAEAVQGFGLATTVASPPRRYQGHLGGSVLVGSVPTAFEEVGQGERQVGGQHVQVP